MYRLDPRTKMICLLVTLIVATILRDLSQTLILVLLIGLLGILLGRTRHSLIYTGLYILLYLLNIFYFRDHVGSFYTMFTAWLSLIYQLFPCCMMAGLMIQTTKIGEFMTALQKIKVPKALIITFSVFLRYIPVIREDWTSIKDAMAMRDIGLSLKGLLIHPKRTVACLYVPLLISASKAADELTMAAVTRGIENPGSRTSCIRIGFHLADVGVMLVFILFGSYCILRRFI